MAVILLEANHSFSRLVDNPWNAAGSIVLIFLELRKIYFDLESHWQIDFKFDMFKKICAFKQFKRTIRIWKLFKTNFDIFWQSLIYHFILKANFIFDMIQNACVKKNWTELLNEIL